ncbi:MAG TPA: hypothetical protein VII23_20655 [Terriglobales bacterium]
MRFSKWILVLTMLGLGSVLWAQTATIRVPGDAPTIPDAISQASSIINGSAPSDVVIKVDPGTYEGPFNLSQINNPNYSVSLIASSGPTVTLLERPVHSGNVLGGYGVRNFTLDGFSVRNRSTDPVNVGASGMSLTDSTNITVQNCSFDVTRQAMLFYVTDPALSSRVQVVNNLVIAGDTNESPAFLYGNGVTLQMDMYNFAPSIGDNRLVVTDNTLRTGASAVRFLHIVYDEFDNQIGTGAGGSLEMVRNDVISWFAAGHNVFGGHNHYVAANHIHDGQTGFSSGCAGPGVWENNLIDNNIQGAIFGFCLGFQSQMTGEARIFRNNTVVNNKGTGFIYADTGAPHDPFPQVYNNVIAFNDYSGIITLLSDFNTRAYAPYDLGLNRNDVYGNTLRGVLDSNMYILTGTTGTPGANYSGIVPNGKDLSVEPGFYDSVRRDFSLKKNSKLVDTGLVTLPVPLRDFVLSKRDSKPDIGAYEYVEAPNLNVRANPTKKGNSPKMD